MKIHPSHQEVGFCESKGSLEPFGMHSGMSPGFWPSSPKALAIGILVPCHHGFPRLASPLRAGIVFPRGLAKGGGS